MNFQDLNVLPVGLGLAGVAFVIWWISAYNRLVRLRNLVKESWSQVAVELHRRHDLIPNLVETVKGYAAHEKAVFDSVSQARLAALSTGMRPEEQAWRESSLSQALKSLLAIAEAYPELQASSNFLSLQHELANTEDRIAATRRFYNSNVRNLNTTIEIFPSSIVARASNFLAAEFFELPDAGIRQAPALSFASPGKTS
ncbi:membrane protein [Betaproteobacteria bacterium]|nr:membrane protein [Betaproteobacteria bacterium]